MGSAVPFVRTRLSAMMFLEFFVWGSWYVAIGGYMGRTLRFSGDQIGWIMSTTALGAIIAPLFVGYVADRIFATERVLCALNVIGGICMILAAQQTKFPGLMTLTMINGLCFMPTLALANSLAFRNIPDPDKFPRIAVLGTIGWIIAGLIVGIALGGTGKSFFYLAGGGGILLGLYCLTLPHTPPKGKEAGGDVFGFGALGLLREPSFLVFVLCAFLISIPANVFFPGCNLMLVETDRPVPTALMTLCQLSEIFVMFTMPWFIARLGLERILALGMLVWAARYLCFATLSFPLILLGLLLHGFAYCFVFVGAYIYIDKRAPRDLRASAQSLIAVVVLGVGSLIGVKTAGYALDQYPPQLAGMPATEETDGAAKKVASAPLPPWTDPEAGKSMWRYLDLSATVEGWLSGKQPAAPPDLGATLDPEHKGRIAPADLARMPGQSLKVGQFTYAREDLDGVLRKIGGKGAEVSVTQDQWIAAQSHQWPQFWFWFSGASAAACVLFWLGSRVTRPPAAEGAPLAK